VFYALSRGDVQKSLRDHAIKENKVRVFKARYLLRKLTHWHLRQLLTRLVENNSLQRSSEVFRGVEDWWRQVRLFDRSSRTNGDLRWTVALFSWTIGSLGVGFLLVRTFSSFGSGRKLRSLDRLCHV